MILFSETTIAFIGKIKKNARNIMVQEMHLNARRQRIEVDGYLYPLNFVVFEDPKILGYFNSHSYQIGLNKNLIHSVTEETLLNILRHELGHFFCFIKYKNTVNDHGKEYRDICRSFHWGEEVFSSKLNLKIEDKKLEKLSQEHVLNKVKKLLALASSENKHEAELATLKANQLLLEHNLKDRNKHEEEDITCLKKVLEGSRVSSKHQAIYDILRSFFVQPVFNYGKGQFYLEVIGSRVNVEMADYVANFLDHEMDALFKHAKKNDSTMKGSGQKASFMKGLAQGYLAKINKTQSQMANTKDLMIIKDQLEKRIQMAYGRLSHKSVGNTKLNSKAHSLGNQAGRDLSIRPGLKNKIKTIFQLN